MNNCDVDRQILIRRSSFHCPCKLKGEYKRSVLQFLIFLEPHFVKDRSSSCFSHSSPKIPKRCDLLALSSDSNRRSFQTFNLTKIWMHLEDCNKISSPATMKNNNRRMIYWENTKASAIFLQFRSNPQNQRITNRLLNFYVMIQWIDASSIFHFLIL